MKILPLSVCVLALAAAGGVAHAEQDAVELEPLTVTAPLNPLDRSQYLLRLLVERSAPCLGCDAVLVASPEPKSVALLKYLLLPTVPPDVDEGARLAADLHHDRDLEYLRP